MNARNVAGHPVAEVSQTWAEACGIHGQFLVAQTSEKSSRFQKHTFIVVRHQVQVSVRQAAAERGVRDRPRPRACSKNWYESSSKTEQLEFGGGFRPRAWAESEERVVALQK
jgi:hypothetical protein